MKATGIATETLIEKLSDYLEHTRELRAEGMEDADPNADSVRVDNDLYRRLFGETPVKPYTRNYDQMYSCIGRLKIWTMIKKKERPGNVKEGVFRNE
ncbi:hypothetical protein [Bacilliculturomica massiliensis]|uniref:hypothetical protein n=1 Tax=Bacilliculturomica massiliensis TaxID=1917867 RepID=UPI0010306CB0|nr:hypothetical protein [Bacilliculturomica massiliensis]